MKVGHFALIILLFLVSSCVSIYFDQPQPVDAKDMKKVPPRLRGTWINGSDTTTIDKKTYYLSEWYIDTVDRAVIDTSISLEIRDGLFYDLGNDPTMGYTFKDMDDQVIIFVPDITEFTLSDSARMRKISKNLFAFNAEKDGEWWEIFLIEQTKDRSINIRYQKESDLTILSTMGAGHEILIDQDGSDDNSAVTDELQKFWKVELNRIQMLEYLNRGGFSDTVLVLDIAAKQ